MRPIEREARSVKEAKRLAGGMRTLGFNRIEIRAHGMWELANGAVRWGPFEVLRLERTRVLARVDGKAVILRPAFGLGADESFLSLRGERR